MTETQSPYLVAVNRIDSLIARAITYSGRAKYNRYVLCLIASRVVGQYERGASDRLAQNIGVTVSRVQDYAHAGDAYRFFRKFGLNSEITMGVSSDHLADAMLWFNKCEMPPADIVADLRTASENRMTREQFGKLMRDHYGEKPPQEWGRQLARIESKLASLSVDTDVPEPARVLLSDIGRIAERARIDERSCIKRAWAVLHLLKAIDNDAESDGWLLAWVHGQADTLQKLLDEWGA
jgi:hypothetical protein